MALGFVLNLQNVWPFSIFRFDDLRVSHELVRKLPIPEHTRQFVFAIREPETQSLIYILLAQNLSEQSALDVEYLVRGIRPDAVVVQVGDTAFSEIQSEEVELTEDICMSVPISVFGVLKRCFLDKINKEKYEFVAGNVVLRKIFGVGFHGHVIAAKKVAEEVGSSFLVVESGFLKSSIGQSNSGEGDTGQPFQGLVSSLVPQKLGSVVHSSSKRFYLTDDVRSKALKLLSSYVDLSGLNLAHSDSVSNSSSEEIQPRYDYEAPSFAQSFYPLLVDLHNVFVDLPLMGRALAYAQDMLSNVNKGEPVDTQTISEVYSYRVAVEGLRIALNSAGRVRIGNSKSPKVDFSELPDEEKSHVLFAQALRSQAEKYKTIVAVVDSSVLAGLRKHWGTTVPPEIKGLVAELVKTYDSDGESSNVAGKKGLIGKPMLAVGAGATAVLGASSLSKTVPMSTLVKVVNLKVPASLKLIITQTQKVMALGFTNTKVVAPGLASSSGFKTSSLLKGAASAEKIRTVVHSVIASAEKTSLSAMRTAFYEIMRKRRVRPIGFLPWATFGCSIATCASLVVYGDGLECAAESLPAAPSIANLGRGIQSLHQASQSAEQKNKSRIQKSIDVLMYRLKKVKVQ